MTGLSDLIPAGAVRLNDRAASWQSAVRAAGHLLEEKGAVTADYTRAMVSAVQEHGPYIVIAPGFALAHARPSDAVRRTAMSVLRLAEPVSFGHETNDPVRLVVALAAADATAHQQALAELAGVLSDEQQRDALFAARSEKEVRAVLSGAAAAGTGAAATAEPAEQPITADDGARGAASSGAAGRSERGQHLALTVCGNGLGTSLFLKNTLEQVLDTWGWSRFVTVEATDTISAKGRAHEADFILTSGEIAKTLGDVGAPMHVIDDFTSRREVDRTLRAIYDV